MAPDYDAITATVAYQSALPFMGIIYAHKLDHQDDTQQEEEPNRDEIITALEWLDKQEDNNKECSPNLFFPICSMMVYMQQGGRYVTSNESKTLQESMLKMELHNYLKKLHEWEDETLQSICWESIEQAKKRSNNNMIRFTTKLTTL